MPEGRDDSHGRAEWTVIPPREWSFTPPSRGDQRRGVMRLSEHLAHMRSNLWLMPAHSRGRRHREASQEEIFIALEGRAMLELGEPPTTVALPRGAIAIVRPRTPLQLVNEGDADSIVLIVGAPPTVGDAAYLPDPRSR